MIVEALKMFAYVVCHVGSRSGYVVEDMENFWPVHQIHGVFVVPKPMFFKLFRGPSIGLG